jgi:ribose transport system ATP-binding protein
MDEPTSSLTAHDTQVLFRVIRTLTSRNVAVVYISHFLEEVKQICDRYTVLRDGNAVASDLVGDTPLRTFIRHMLGRTVSELYPGPGSIPSDVVLQANGITGIRSVPKHASLRLRRGEILGVFGLVGAGRSELVRSLFGLQKVSEGTLSVSGNPDIKAAWLDPPRSLSLGMNLLSEDRKSEGLAGTLSVLQNLTLSRLREYTRWGVLHLARERASGAQWLNRLSLTYHDVGQRADTLSGGNQQKLCIARMLHQDSDILFLDEPTRGVDVGSKAEIYTLVRELASAGKAIVMISSYLPELLGMCHTISVMHRGRLTSPRPVEECSESDIMEVATAGEAHG